MHEDFDTIVEEYEKHSSLVASDADFLETVQRQTRATAVNELDVKARYEQVYIVAVQEH